MVSSTHLLAEIGDGRWRELLVQFYAAVRGQLNRFQGQEMDTAGDGLFAVFYGPARAITCACAIRDAVAHLGITVRAGLHTGESEYDRTISKILSYFISIG